MLSVVIPYRNRENNLTGLLTRLRKFLRDYECIVVEQCGEAPFNRGTLMNIGYLLSASDQICFHDVDMLPMDADYSHVSVPTCLISKCNLYDDAIPYPSYFGGVTLFSRSNLKQVNGFSNRYFGWGKEDDDMWLRCHNAGLAPERRAGCFHHQDHPREHCHTHDSNNQAHLDAFCNNPEFQWIDGLQSIKYSLIQRRFVDSTVFATVSLDSADL